MSIKRFLTASIVSIIGFSSVSMAAVPVCNGGSAPVDINLLYVQTDVIGVRMSREIQGLTIKADAAREAFSKYIQNRNVFDTDWSKLYSVSRVFEHSFSNLIDAAKGKVDEDTLKKWEETFNVGVSFMTLYSKVRSSKSTLDDVLQNPNSVHTVNACVGFFNKDIDNLRKSYNSFFKNPPHSIISTLDDMEGAYDIRVQAYRIRNR